MVKIKFLLFLIPIFLIGCAITPEEKEYRKNKAIVDSAIADSKPKPIINPNTAVISDTIRGKLRGQTLKLKTK
jgi:hypothetical protein